MDEKKVFDYDKKVAIRSIADWGTGANRITEGGSINISPNGTVMERRSEIIAQHQSGNNKALDGIDGNGTHATWIVDDAETRRELGFDSEDGKTKQLVFSDELVKKVFDYKTQSAFEQHFKESFITRAEYKAVLAAIKRLKINDYSKIRFVENYTGFKYDG